MISPYTTIKLTYNQKNEQWIENLEMKIATHERNLNVTNNRIASHIIEKHSYFVMNLINILYQVCPTI